MEAARRAISSPLLEGASINGARGVIINVTGGPDLSLVEVSEASCIVQEAADEDANIIFGAVVDPALKGKVKITVIATGFGAPSLARPAPSTVQTPVDMTPYTEVARVRADPAPAPALSGGGRLSIARRPPLDLPLVASMGGSASSGGSGGSVAPPYAPGAEGADAADPALHANTGDEKLSADPDFDLSSAFDVPAFLRRQEG